jgi:hypothetical protein
MSVNEQAPDRKLLFGYLVGSLSAEESERFDELSISNDQFASQLIAAENDLIDAYVGGELSGDTLERFRVNYLSSPLKLEKIRFAETLLAYQKQAAPAVAPRASVFQWFTLPQLVPQWGLAVAVLFLATAGYLMFDNLRLRNDMRAAHAALQTREQQLQRELTEQRTVAADTAKELAAVRESLARLDERTAAPGRNDPGRVLSFMLLAPKRGAAEITKLQIPPATQQVGLQLELESVDFRGYEAALRDPASDRILWRSGRLKAPAAATRRFLSIVIPANLLRRQTYVLELTGIPAEGSPVIVASYPFAVEAK